MKKLIIVSAAAFLSTIGNSLAGTWTTLDMPGSLSTEIRDIDGDIIVGNYAYPVVVGQRGFKYDGANWTTIMTPASESHSDKTYVTAIDSGKTVGYYFKDGYHGFKVDDTGFTTIDAPGASNTYITAVGGSDYFGYYNDSTGTHGFRYDGANWSIIDTLGNGQTEVHDIDGSKWVGSYANWSDTDGGSWNGFLFDGMTWTTLNMPGASSTFIYGIDGDNIVGNYTDTYGNHGFLYNGTWTTLLDMPPGATSIDIYGIEGNKIVGTYYTDATTWHGFVYEIPEPASLLLLGLGGLLIRKR